MRHLRLLGVGTVLIFCLACETKNIGGGLPHIRPVFTGITLSDTTPMAGDNLTATITFFGGTGPYTFTITFSDCVTPAVHTVVAPTGATTASLTVTLDSFTTSTDADGKDCTMSVTGTDANGILGGPVTGYFHVEPIESPQSNIPLTFNAATCTVTATIGDADNDDVVVEATTVPASLTTIGPQTVVGGNGTVDFPFSPTDIIAGGSGDVTFTATDANGATATGTIHVNCNAAHILPDTLYAIPAQQSVNVGEPVTIIVLTGDPASPFQYMTGVRVVTDAGSGMEYVDDSFNLGMPGGDADALDGIWADNELGIGDGDFLLAPDSFYQIVPVGGGLAGLDFNVTPLGISGDMHTGEGALFNFQVTFAAPGTYPLGFQLFETVNRTYYQDGNQTPDYFWSDITNNHVGIPNTITVN